MNDVELPDGWEYKKGYINNDSLISKHVQIGNDKVEFLLEVLLGLTGHKPIMPKFKFEFGDEVWVVGKSIVNHQWIIECKTNPRTYLAENTGEIYIGNDVEMIFVRPKDNCHKSEKAAQAA